MLQATGAFDAPVSRPNAWTRGGSQPLYRQFQALLRAAIERRAFMPDEALPSERDPADACGISRVAVRKAIDALPPSTC